MQCEDQFGHNKLLAAHALSDLDPGWRLSLWPHKHNEDGGQEGFVISSWKHAFF